MRLRGDNKIQAQNLGFGPGGCSGFCVWGLGRLGVIVLGMPIYSSDYSIWWYILGLLLMKTLTCEMGASPSEFTLPSAT